MSNKGRSEVVAHTAEVGLRIYGASLRELFRGAAGGLLKLYKKRGSVSPRRRDHISLKAGAVDELLVLWLNELIFLVASRRRLYSKIIFRELSPAALDAEVWTEAISPSRHYLSGEVKAATYHRISVARRGNGWHALVFFDV
ncbi:MAG: archease [Elusimicrobia bacterium]|nr:archease [Elusimicrobiota bacterium]